MASFPFAGKCLGSGEFRILFLDFIVSVLKWVSRNFLDSLTFTSLVWRRIFPLELPRSINRFLEKNGSQSLLAIATAEFTFGHGILCRQAESRSARFKCTSLLGLILSRYSLAKLLCLQAVDIRSVIPWSLERWNSWIQSKFRNQIVSSEWSSWISFSFTLRILSSCPNFLWILSISFFLIVGSIVYLRTLFLISLTFPLQGNYPTALIFF